MLRRLISVTFVAQSLTGLAMAQDGASSSPYDANVEDLTARPPLVLPGQPPMLGIHWSREFAGGMLQAAKEPAGDMTYHGGPTLLTVRPFAIYWGPGWTNLTFVGDKIAGLDSFYAGLNGSNYAATSDEYTDATGMHITSTITYLGHAFDPTTASGGGKTSEILAEVCKVINNNPDPQGFYAVYADIKRGKANYCSYHSFGSCNGRPLQFAFFWNLDGDAGCDPQDTSGLHSQGLAALANSSAHEISEARTDPTRQAWYDAIGAENGDKCAWTFRGPVAFLNGTQWKLQGEWSNAAYDSGTGYPNSFGQNGCLAGN